MSAIYGPPVPSPHQISAEVNSTSKQNGGCAPISAWNPPGIRAIIPAGCEYARSESFWSPAGEPGRKIQLGDTWTWSGTFVADLGPARLLPHSHIIWQVHPGAVGAELPIRISVGAASLNIGGRDYAGGGVGSWWSTVLSDPTEKAIEHSISVTVLEAATPGAGQVTVVFDGVEVHDAAIQTWPDPAMGVTDKIIRSGIYRGPVGSPTPRAQSCTWRDVSYVITSP